MGIDYSIIGRKYGRLTVLKLDHTTTRRTYWLCECDCGNTTVVERGNLTTGHTTSCGCKKTEVESLVGQKFGRLTVIKIDHMDYRHESHWLCECDCQDRTIISVSRSHLLSGNTVSCGCYRSDNMRRRSTTHGMSSTRLYNIWEHMRNRCDDENNERYDRYGGRGIAVCDEWEDFENFRDWALDNGYSDELTIDRRDNDGGYTSENCRWVDSFTQANNTSRNRYISYGGETHSVAEWARILGVKYRIMLYRINHGDMSDFEKYFKYRR